MGRVKTFVDTKRKNKTKSVLDLHHTKAQSNLWIGTGLFDEFRKGT